jgi:hypothetical protein
MMNEDTKEWWVNNYYLTGISKSDVELLDEANWAIEQAIASGASTNDLEEKGMEILCMRDRLFRQMRRLKKTVK